MKQDIIGKNIGKLELMINWKIVRCCLLWKIMENYGYVEWVE